MSEAIAREALKLWGLEQASVGLVAQRENMIYRVVDQESNTSWALRLHRTGLRSLAEILSESQWQQALSAGGISVPVPVATRCGQLCVDVNGQCIDMQRWLEGDTLNHHALPEHYRTLGKTMAQLHNVSDQWVAPDDFQRPSWDRDGLIGDAPVWGRFRENPALNKQQRTLLQDFRTAASAELEQRHASLDFGLIHADLVTDNVLVDHQQLHLIDFDDSGFGYRLFDLATVILRLQREPNHEALTEALVKGYINERDLDMEALDLFLALRACTYIGWIISRVHEPTGAERCARFINTGCQHVKNWLPSSY